MSDLGAVHKATIVSNLEEAAYRGLCLGLVRSGARGSWDMNMGEDHVLLSPGLVFVELTPLGMNTPGDPGCSQVRTSTVACGL
jgi:hypothetical protein